VTPSHQRHRRFSSCDRDEALQCSFPCGSDLLGAPRRVYSVNATPVILKAVNSSPMPSMSSFP
jgi:hypothetical protein